MKESCEIYVRSKFLVLSLAVNQNCFSDSISLLLDFIGVIPQEGRSRLVIQLAQA